MRNGQGNARWGFRGFRGFTLIELLVVIAIIALLISIMLPGLGKAKLTAKSIKEQAVGRQMMTALSAYYSESRDKVMPAGCHWAWNHLPVTYFSIYPQNPFQPQQELEGSITKAWGLYFMTWGQFTFEGMQLDKPTMKSFLARPTTGPGGAPPNSDPTSAPAAYGWNMGLGMNGVYVGGAYSFGAFRGQGNTGGPGGWGDPEPRGNPRASGGNFYVSRAADVRMPSKLLVLGSSRGQDVKTSGAFFTYGADWPDGPTRVPGYWLIAPPTRHPMARGGRAQPYTLGGGWNPSNKFDSRLAPSTWGMLDMRYDNKAVTVRFDGSVAMQGLEQLRDMLQWSNVADSPTWTFPTNPSQITW